MSLQKGRMMDEIDEFFASLPEGRCKHCEFSKCVVANDQWMFLGCCHEPYHGKWVKEIEHCPKEVKANEV